MAKNDKKRDWILQYEYWEYAASGIDQAQTVGARARTWSVQLRQARYRFSGADGRIDTADDVISNYTYEYDTLGRLIHSSRLEDGKIVLYTGHQYDTSDRILSQNWQMGKDGYEESYVYADKDGTLSQMTVTGGDKLTFSYDGLKRLSSKTLTDEDSTGTTSILKVDYGYRDIDGTRTTTHIPVYEPYQRRT